MSTLTHDQESTAADNAPVWKRIGTETKKALTSSSALVAAKLDWTVEEQPLFTSTKNGPAPIFSHKAIVRSDTQSILGVVGSRYTPVQNMHAVAWLDDLVTIRHAGTFEAAGSLRGGAIVWAMLRLHGELRIRGTDDVSHSYILVANSHDGSIAFRVLSTFVRLVCGNALSWIMRHAGSDSVSLKHTPTVLERMADSFAVLDSSLQLNARFENHANIMALTKVSPRRFGDYLDRVLPAPKPLGADAEPTAARRQIEANFESEFQSLKGIKHSAWAAYNAVSQYVDHERPLRKGSVLAKSERRFENVLLGSGAELKRKAWQEALLLTRN